MIGMSVDAYLNRSLTNTSRPTLGFSSHGILERFSVHSFVLMWFYAQVSLHFTLCHCFPTAFVQMTANWERSQLGLGLLKPPLSAADLRPRQQGSTVRASHRHPAGHNPAQQGARWVINYTGWSHRARWNTTLWDSPAYWSTGQGTSG